MTFSRIDRLLRRRAGSSSREVAFWKGVAAAANKAGPNWGQDLNPGRTPLSVDAFVYLVDTSNLWMAAAAISPERLAQLLRGRGVAEGGSSAERDRAAQCIAAASARTNFWGWTDPSTLRDAFVAGLMAIATSPGYAVISAQETSALGIHHWILLLYRLANGEVIAGVGHVDQPYAGMLDHGSLRELVELMVEMDLGAESSIVSAAVRAHGGARLSPELSPSTPA